MAVVAFVLTASFAVLSLPARPEERVPLWAYLGLLAAYLTGYTLTLAANWRGCHVAAVALLLATELFVHGLIGTRT